ncbi:Vacuolar sorting protein Vps20 [Schizosaccharomyces pombe]
MGVNSSKINDKDRSILSIKEQRDKLLRYSKRLEKIEQLEIDIARKCLRDSDKRGALRALKAKKLYSGLITQTYGQLGNIEQLLSTIEFTLIQKDVMFGLQEGTNLIRQLQADMPLERVERICNDRDEAMSYVDEVNDMLQGRMSRDQEDEIQEELDSLIREQEDEKVKDLEKPGFTPSTGVDVLPSVPLKNAFPSLDESFPKAASVSNTSSAVVIDEELRKDPVLG